MIKLREVSTCLVVLFASLLVVANAYSYTIGYDHYNPIGVVGLDRQDPLKATEYDPTYDDMPLLGGSVNFTALGFEGSIVLTVQSSYAIVDGDGYDFTLYETTYGSNADNWNSYKETAEVFAFNGVYKSDQASAASNWISLGWAKQDASFDLSAINLLFTTAIKIVDVSKSFGFTGNGDGYDVDGIVIHNIGKPVPVPAAAWMLGAGLVALVGVRRRMNR